MSGTKTIISNTLVGLSFTKSQRQKPCLVQFSGQDLGRPFFVKGNEIVIGREPRAGIRLNEMKVSRRHARVIVTPQGVFLEDLNSANGTYLNGRLISRSHPLKDGDMVTIGPAAFKFFAAGSAEQLFYDELYRKATVDQKTGVFNDKFLFSALRSEIDMSKNFGRHLSVLILDLDYFKKVNDVFGHLFGDHVLKITAQVTSQVIRKNDVLCRYGGEEFVVILPETDLRTAVKLAERVRLSLENHVFYINHNGKKVKHIQTMSIGVSQMGPGTGTVESILKAADKMLYKSKHAGRNRVSA